MSLHPLALRVGKKYEGKGYLDYNDVKYDPDEWVKADEYLPREFDLCKLKLKEGRDKMGWWCGNGWEGMRISHKDEVLFWKRWIE